MKNMIQKMREKEGGFTLAELLVVVAIILILVAIAIPVFSTQLEKSREATDLANIRAAYAEASAEAIGNSDGGSATTDAMVHTDTAWGQIDASTKIGKSVVKSTSGIKDVAAGKAVTVTVSSGGDVSFSAN